MLGHPLEQSQYTSSCWVPSWTMWTHLNRVSRLPNAGTPSWTESAQFLILEHPISHSHHISSGRCTRLHTGQHTETEPEHFPLLGYPFISSIPHARVLSCSESTHFFMPTTHLRMVRTLPHGESSSWTELAHFLVPTHKLRTSQVFSQPITRPIPNHNFDTGTYWMHRVLLLFKECTVYCTGCLKTDYSNNKTNTGNQLMSFIGGTIFYLL